MRVSKNEARVGKSPQWKHPFGVQVRRFGKAALHPQLTSTVLYDTSPCHYDPVKNKCVRQPNRNRWEPWKIATESLEFSKNLGYGHGDILAYRNFMAGQLGPGSHDIDSIFKHVEVSHCQPCPKQSFGKEKRFHEWEIISPGPARYNVKVDKCKFPHEGPSIGCTKRFVDRQSSWLLPCNRYSVKHPESLEALLRKTVSLRGPYDCFTGPRDPSNMYNKMSAGISSSPDKYYSWTSDLTILLTDPRNSSKGKFNKAERFLEHPVARHMLNDLSSCYRDRNWPGPANYVICDSITKLKEQQHPFMISELEVRPRFKWKLSPGPGRYNIKSFRCSVYQKKRPTSVFLSKSQRTEYKAVEFNAF